MSDTKGEAKGGLASNTLTNSQTSYTNFLFGENLADRVLLPAKEAPNDTKKEETENGGEPSENGESSTSSKLPEKRKYEVITGEEDESNVLQIFCKLYLWDSTSALWKEKGKGMLRLNDKMKDDKICSRLVMRTAGSLKVILNASIVSGMKFELSNENCLRFINIDGIYLFKGKEKEIEQLNSAIETRLRDLSKKVKVDNGETGDDKDNNEPSEGASSKTEESPKEESKEKAETSEPTDSEGSQLKEELEKNEDSDENSRKENVPEEENKTVEQNDEKVDKVEDEQSNSKTETITNSEGTAASPPDLDQN